MKYNIVKLLFLLLTISVISFSRKETTNSKEDKILKDEFTCLNTVTGDGIKKTGNQKCTVQQQNPKAKEQGGGGHVESAGDYYLPGSPVSRYILLQ
jgi:hypothetical protein